MSTRQENISAPNIPAKQSNSRMFALVEKTVNRIASFALTVAVINLTIMGLLVFSDVTLRYFFSRPIIGSIELTEFLMVGAGFSGLASCTLGKQHIKVDVFSQFFPYRVQWVLEIVNYIIVAAFGVLFGWHTYTQSTVVKMLQLSGLVTKIPVYPFYWIVAFSFLFLALAALVLLVQTVTEGVKK